MGFGPLRVINDDIFGPGGGFGMHPHRDMEILTWVLSGTVEHKDSLGNGGTITPGEVQRITAGTGVLHSEFNPSATVPLHLYQIWIQPHTRGLAPQYDQRAFADKELTGRLHLIASADGRNGSMLINQDASLLIGRLKKGDSTSHPLAAGRIAWVQVARGAVTLNGKPMTEGDGAATTKEPALDLKSTADAEVLVFDLQ